MLAQVATAAAGRPPKRPPPKPAPKPLPAIRFSASARKGQLLVTTPGYQLSLTQAGGAVADLLDRATGTHLVRGESGCLWGADAATGASVGDCAPSPGAPSSLTYRWNQASTTLTLTYADDATSKVSGTATITVHAQYFDLRLTLAPNPLQSVISRVFFPGDLLGASSTVAAGYVPTYLPGLRLKPSFFSGSNGVVFTYPGRWAFADYIAYDAGNSSVALYSVNSARSAIQPAELGFVRAASPDVCSGSYFCVRHAFDTWVVPGATWTSPTVRVRIGQTAAESILAYRHDNGVDAYPSVAAKLGPSLANLAQAPQIKADLKEAVPFPQWGPELKRLPSPALIHPVSFQAGGFDVSDPDFLPPDQAFGTTADFDTAVGLAHDLGLFVMPYLNTSWWSVDSPTLADLPAPLSINDLAVQNAAGQPRLEQYGDRAGYVVSPYAPFVRDRVASLLDQWKTDVPVDCLFFDQVGARPWLRDFNPAAPNPEAYADGWLNLLTPYANRCVMVEDGWDRLAAISVGFEGGLLLMERQFAEPDRMYGPGNWEPYPLALWLLHDKVLLYQHDLYEGTMTNDPEVLTWNLAFGFMLSYNWDSSVDSLASPWLDVVGSFQHALGPYFAGQPLTSYSTVAPDVTRTTFGNYSVLANWSASNAYDSGKDRVAPGGFLASSLDGAVRAGAYSGILNGAPLSPGTHYILVQRTPSTVTVHQPLGDATDLTIDLPSGWKPGAPVRATAEIPGGGDPTEVSGVIQGSAFVFHCLGPQDAQPAPTYRISVG